MFMHNRKLPDMFTADGYKNDYLTDRLIGQRLLALSSLIIPLGFFLLLILAPSASDSGTSPLVMIISLVIVAQAAFRLSLNWNKALGDRYQLLCVSLDFLSLTVILLAYALTYEVPFSVALKSPTANVFFIFLASRIVLFNRAIILQTGAFAVVTWICLIGIALLDPDSAGRTSSFIEYLTSFKILIGAEVERLLQFGFITGILYVFLQSSRKDPPTGFLRRLFFLGSLSRFLLSNKSAATDRTFALIEVRAENVADVDKLYSTALKLIPSLPVLKTVKIALIGRLSDQSAALSIVYPKGAYDLEGILEGIHRELKERVALELANNASTLIIGACKLDRTMSANRHLRYTDAAIREAIASGRNSVEFNSELLEKIERKHAIERTIRSGLKCGGLSVVYQPIMDLMTDMPIGFEALIRLKDKDDTAISPSEFIPIAEATGLIHEVTDYLCDRIAKEAPEICEIFKAHEVQPYININISPSQIRDVDRILCALRRAEQGGVKINIEVTESCICDDELAAKAFDRLLQEGFSIAIDDFGTGYSSLQRLETLQFSTLKIDQSFVSNIGKQGSNDFLKAVINLSRVSADYTIVEGVETLEQKLLLMKMGVRFCQGYYWTRPVDMRGLTKYLSDSFGYEKIGPARLGYAGFG